MPFSKVSSGLILFDAFAYSNGTLTTVGASDWSNSVDINNDPGDFQVVSSQVETEPTDTSGNDFVALNSTLTWDQICVGALISADDNDDNPTLTKFVHCGILAKGNDDQANENAILCYVQSLEFDQSVRELTLDHRLSGAVVSNQTLDISSKQNFVDNPTRMKLYIEDSVQEVYYDDEEVLTSTVTRNDTIKGRPGLYHGGNHFSGGFAEYDDFFACIANTVTVGGLVDSYQVKINGKTATESDGTATVAMAESWFPQTIIEVLDDAGASIDTLDVSSDASSTQVFGGDVYSWTAPPAGDPWTDTTITSLESSLPWWVLWATTDSDYSTGVDYELRVQHINHLRISDETARAHLIYDSVISKP